MLASDSAAIIVDTATGAIQTIPFLEPECSSEDYAHCSRFYSKVEKTEVWDYFRKETVKGSSLTAGEDLFFNLTGHMVLSSSEVEAGG